MCDYSLNEFPNRLAKEGENLILCRFPTGSMGFTSLPEYERQEAWVKNELEKSGDVASWFGGMIRRWKARKGCTPLTAVCLPPGSKLQFMNVPQRLQKELGVGEVETVTFTQTSYEAYTYRDAVRFANGKVLLLIRLSEHMRAKVLSLGDGGSEFIPTGIESPVLDYRPA